MSFALQQIVIPVAVLGAQPDPGETLEDWLDYFAGLVGPMRAAMPCKGYVLVSLDVAARMYGSSLPEPDPNIAQALLSQCGSERSNLQVWSDRGLPENTVRLE